MSIKKTLHLLRGQNNIKELKDEIKKLTINCLKCKTHKPNRNKSVIYFDKHLKASNVFDKLSIDILGPLNIENFDHNFESDKIYFLNCTDIYSRYTECYATNHISSLEISKIFKMKWLKNFPTPKEIIMDNGIQFRGLSFCKILKEYDIKEFFIAPYSPESNGISERLNQKILNAIRTFEGKDFKKLCVVIWQTLNLTPNRSTGFAPYEIITELELITQKPIPEIDKKITASIKKAHTETEKKMNKYLKIKDIENCKHLFIKFKENKLDPF
ncbi:Transposon Tf2-9 polyprotein [Dictyocoela muelleri]|nr:Transposon Tf2-9 polyprotein [Dictyocoela muelleri]